MRDFEKSPIGVFYIVHALLERDCGEMPYEVFKSVLPQLKKINTQEKNALLNEVKMFLQTKRFVDQEPIFIQNSTELELGLLDDYLEDNTIFDIEQYLDTHKDSFPYILTGLVNPEENREILLMEVEGDSNDRMKIKLEEVTKIDPVKATLLVGSLFAATHYIIKPRR